jgi:hypothetical protein
LIQIDWCPYIGIWQSGGAFGWLKEFPDAKKRHAFSQIIEGQHEVPLEQGLLSVPRITLASDHLIEVKAHGVRSALRGQYHLTLLAKPLDKTVIAHAFCT